MSSSWDSDRDYCDPLSGDAKKALGIIVAALVVVMLWLAGQPATPANGPCVKVAHDEVCP